METECERMETETENGLGVRASSEECTRRPHELQCKFAIKTVVKTLEPVGGQFPGETWEYGGKAIWTRRGNMEQTGFGLTDGEEAGV
jgi:hypothetical protein